MPTIHLLVKGKVQGVFYRVSAREFAEELGVTGWVKNTPGGDVEAMATGTKEQLDKFVSWCKSGPRRANVTEVIVTDSGDQYFEAFAVLR